MIKEFIEKFKKLIQSLEEFIIEISKVFFVKLEKIVLNFNSSIQKLVEPV